MLESADLCFMKWKVIFLIFYDSYLVDGEHNLLPLIAVNLVTASNRVAGI